MSQTITERPPRAGGHETILGGQPPIRTRREVGAGFKDTMASNETTQKDTPVVSLHLDQNKLTHITHGPNQSTPKPTVAVPQRPKTPDATNRGWVKAFGVELPLKGILNPTVQDARKTVTRRATARMKNAA